MNLYVDIYFTSKCFYWFYYVKARSETLLNVIILPIIPNQIRGNKYLLQLVIHKKTQSNVTKGFKQSFLSSYEIKADVPKILYTALLFLLTIYLRTFFDHKHLCIWYHFQKPRWSESYSRSLLWRQFFVTFTK